MKQFTACLFTFLLLPIGLFAQIDSTKLNWLNLGSFLNGGETFQIWTGHAPDTLETKRGARAHGGGGGGGNVGDTIMVRVIRADSAGLNWAKPGFIDSTGKRVRFEYLVPGWADSAVIIGSSQYMAGKLPAINYVEGSMIAPNYPIPLTTAADTFQLYGFINGSRLFKATPGDLNDLDVEFQLYIKNMESGDSTWMTVGYWYRSNQTGGYPPYFSRDTTVYTLSDWGGWGKVSFGFQPYTRLRNGYPFYHTTWWVFGVMPNALVKFRWKICYNGQTTVEDAYPRLYPTFAGSRNVTFMIYQKPTYVVTDKWITSAQMDSTTWNFSGNTPIYIGGDLWVSNNITGGWGKFYRSLTVGSHIDSTASISDTIVGTLNLYTDHGNLVTIRPGGHLNGTFIVPEIAHDGMVDSLLSQKDKLRTIPNSSVPIQYLMADSNFTIILAGDTAKLRSTTGAGGAGASFYTSPGDKPPNSASSFNDEFDGANGTMIDTGAVGIHKWQWLGTYGHPNNAITQRGTALIWSDTGSISGDFIKMLGQKITDANWTITVKMKAMANPVNYTYVGLFALDSTNGRMSMFRVTFFGAAGSGKQIDAAHNTGPKGSIAYAYTGSYRQQWDAEDYVYLKMEKVGVGTLNYYTSRDGLTWLKQFTEGTAGFTESSGRINWVGIFIGSQIATGQITSSFYWFRYNWTADFDPTLHH